MKKEILEAILDKLNKDAKAYQFDLQTLDTNINLDENDLIEKDDISQKDQSTDISDGILMQTANLDNTIATVKTYQTISRNEISPGALVETNDMYLLVGVGLPALHINNKKVIGITETTKIYPLLKGKRKGDRFTLGNQEYTILSVS